MSWIYQQSTGRTRRDPDDGMAYPLSYAGCGVGKNVCDMQNVHDVGPLPQGWYTIQEPVDTKTHGPYVLWLTPDKENEMFGRSGFGWHSDSIVHPGMASEGCIISPRSLRTTVWGSGDNRLQVVA